MWAQELDFIQCSKVIKVSGLLTNCLGFQCGFLVSIEDPAHGTHGGVDSAEIAEVAGLTSKLTPKNNCVHVRNFQIDSSFGGLDKKTRMQKCRN